MATNVYIDGFNLYYGALKGTDFRWLDLSALCRELLPKDHVGTIRYFTARVRQLPNDRSAPQRQGTYLRALETIPNITIHFGHFLQHRRRLPLANPGSGPKTAEVLKIEEKGSDVNLATMLLLDAFKGACDTSVVISNDSDLKTPLNVARSELGMRVGVVNPHPASRRSHALSRNADFFKQLRRTALAKSQFADPLTDSRGVFHKPVAW